MKILMIILAFFISLNNVNASFEVRKFDTSQQEQRFKKLINELRCVVCQNQNLADSNAELAQDLRKQVHKMIKAGQSDEEILDFMVSRYGQFVLYKPELNASTFILWIGPFIVLIVGLFILIAFIRQQKKVVTTFSGSDKQKIKQLLDEDKEQNT